MMIQQLIRGSYIAGAAAEQTLSRDGSRKLVATTSELARVTTSTITI